MLGYKEVDGDLIEFAKAGDFDVITHGCNCFCQMGAGIAPQMAAAFDCDRFSLEAKKHKGDMNKLGQIEWEFNEEYNLFVVNSYTQYGFGRNNPGGTRRPLDYQALALCLRKINHEFVGRHIGLPQIGCGLAGGDWFTVRTLIRQELKDCKITVVNFKK